MSGVPNVRRTCSSVEASSSWVASRLASPRSRRGVGTRLSPVQHFECVAQPGRVLGDVGVMCRDERDGAAHEVGDYAPDVAVGDVLATRDRGEPDRAVGLGPVEAARHAVGDARTGAAAHRLPKFLFAHGAEPLKGTAMKTSLRPPKYSSGGSVSVSKRQPPLWGRRPRGRPTPPPAPVTVKFMCPRCGGSGPRGCRKQSLLRPSPGMPGRLHSRNRCVSWRRSCAVSQGLVS